MSFCAHMSGFMFDPSAAIFLLIGMSSSGMMSSSIPSTSDVWSHGQVSAWRWHWPLPWLGATR